MAGGVGEGGVAGTSVRRTQLTLSLLVTIRNQISSLAGFPQKRFLTSTLRSKDQLSMRETTPIIGTTMEHALQEEKMEGKTGLEKRGA